jgi:hypothetical protein
MPRSRDPLLLCLAALLALNAIGFPVALADGLAELGSGLLNGSKTHAPLVIWGLQLAGTTLLLTRSGRAGAVGGALTLLACTVSLTAVAFDGDLAADGLAAGHIALQVAIATLTATLWGLTAARLARGRRRAPRVATPVAEG